MRLDDLDDRDGGAGEEAPVGQRQARLEDRDRGRNRVEDDRRPGRADAPLRVASRGDERVRPLRERDGVRDEGSTRDRRRDAVDVDRDGRAGAPGNLDVPQRDESPGAGDTMVRLGGSPPSWTIRNETLVSVSRPWLS